MLLKPRLESWDKRHTTGKTGKNFAKTLKKYTLPSIKK